MEKLIITFIAGGIVLNLVYIIAILSQGILLKNPWYIFLTGTLMIVTAVIIRNRRQ